jgi:hypothetical protein
VSAYFAPLLSTVLLVATELSEGSPVLWIAALAITGGALLASKDMLGRKRESVQKAELRSEP